MSVWPSFSDSGDLPPGIYKATPSGVIEYFGKDAPQRHTMARRLAHIYTLTAQTGHLARFIVFGSFVTAKLDPGDVDIFGRSSETAQNEGLSRW